MPSSKIETSLPSLMTSRLALRREVTRLRLLYNNSIFLPTLHADEIDAALSYAEDLLLSRDAEAMRKHTQWLASYTTLDFQTMQLPN